MALKRRITFVADEQDAAELKARAKAGGHSLGHEIRQAVKTHLSPESYDSIAGVILEAAERIRQRKKDEPIDPEAA